jgi:hypothetical protein
MKSLRFRMTSTAASRSGASQSQGKCAEKYFRRFEPRNPLKSLDSRKRIQGNPRQSNAREQDLRGETRLERKKPNRIDWTDVAARCRRRGMRRPW